MMLTANTIVVNTDGIVKKHVKIKKESYEPWVE